MSDEKVVIPGIELLDELGRGTHSVVYNARRGDVPCVVKLPLRNETGLKLKILSRRCRREAIALARLRHPIVPRVLEIGVVARSPFIVTELVTGETLAARLGRRPLSEDAVVSMGSQLADALVHIHQSGLVHRDIKPRNILFESSTGAIRLVDFGFAASVDAAFRILEPVGTLEYSAPEQISDARPRVDGRADLYALGCVLYECLATKPPFAELDPRRLLHQHLGFEPPDVRDAAPNVSKAFSAVLKRLLARSPDDRYPSADALLYDLQHIGEIRATDPPYDLGRHGLRSSTLHPVFGRGVEFKRLEESWSEVERARTRSVVLRGTAGSGKSHLARALVEGVTAAGRPVLLAECRAGDPKPFSAIRELVEAYVKPSLDLQSGESSPSVSQIRELAGDLAALLKVLSPALSVVFAGAMPVPESRDAQHIFVEGLAEFLVRIFRQLGPAVVFVDDLQWLDNNSRSVLRRAMDRADEYRILYLFTARGDQYASSVTEAERLLSAPFGQQISLSGIDEESLGALVASYLGDADFDKELLRSIAQFGDGTPLSALEVLRLILDEGMLVPAWGAWKFDAHALAAGLPRTLQGVLERRMESLDQMTRSMLSAAAVAGMTFSDRLLPTVCGLEEGHVNAALAEARRAMLVSAGTQGFHRFTHDAVREALLRGLSDSARRELHQKIAESMSRLWNSDEARAGGPRVLAWPLSNEDPDADVCYTIASHFAKGVPGRTPAVVYETNIAAGRLAFNSFDNERALAFFGSALEASKLFSSKPDADLAFFVGEAKLRIGALEEGLQQFGRVLETSDDPMKQALTLTRMAWIHEMKLDSAAAWVTLEAAFGKLGENLPLDSLPSVLRSLGAWLGGLLKPPRPAADAAERARLETLCALYYQTTRVASEDSKPLRMIQAALRGLAPARRLGPSPSLVRIYVILSFILTVLGMRRMGRKYLARAEQMARLTGDPVAFAHVLQVHSVLAAWAGETREALEAGGRCLKDYGHWRELSEYCLLCYDQQMLESVRGRYLVAWDWIEQAIAKANQNEATAHVLEFVILGARATLTSLGREAEADVLLHRLQRITIPVPKDSGFYVGTHGPRLRAQTEKGDFGPGFERIVSEVREMRYNPKRAHLSITEYYVHVSHARVEAVLRGERWNDARLDLVALALRDLKSSARIPLVRAHAIVIEGYWAMFTGDYAKAETLFAKSERLAQEEPAPWVLFAAHRGRAHLYRARGKSDSAGDQAKLAEALAIEHGMAYRLKWIRSEFGLTQDWLLRASGDDVREEVAIEGPASRLLH